MKTLLTLLLLPTLGFADLRRQDGADVPPGTTISFAGSSCPTGFLRNDGSAKPRTTYSKLFTAIGTTYGVGDGSTTFNLANYLPTIQKFTSGSGTYTTSLSASYIKIRMVGGGGGGAGSGLGGAFGGIGGVGTQSFFRVGASPDILIALGGNAGTPCGGSSLSGVGGAASIASPAIGTAITGGSGFGACNGIVNAYSPSVMGGISVFGGNGTVVVPNTGAGGYGPQGISSASIGYSGTGGGAGGYVEAIISSPAAAYSYSVGAGGAGGAAGTSSSTGGVGASGYIEVTEYNLLGNCIKY
jgi:hypothetical protein